MLRMSPVDGKSDNAVGVSTVRSNKVCCTLQCWNDLPATLGCGDIREQSGSPVDRSIS